MHFSTIVFWESCRLTYPVMAVSFLHPDLHDDFQEAACRKGFGHASG